MLFRAVARWQWLVLVAMVLVPVAGASAGLIPVSSYSYGVAPASGYPDGGLTKLTDDVTQLNTDDYGYGTGKVVGWQSDADVTFDLGQPYLLNEVQVNYIVSYGGIYGWNSWTVTLSDADKNPVYSHDFTSDELSPAAGWHMSPTYGGYWGTLAVSPTQAAQYVELVGTHASQWGMIAEVQFPAVPEPSTLVLLAAGLLGLLAYAWRKRK